MNSCIRKGVEEGSKGDGLVNWVGCRLNHMGRKFGETRSRKETLEYVKYKMRR